MPKKNRIKTMIRKVKINQIGKMPQTKPEMRIKMLNQAITAQLLVIWAELPVQQV